MRIDSLACPFFFVFSLVPVRATASFFEGAGIYPDSCIVADSLWLGRREVTISAGRSSSK